MSAIDFAPMTDSEYLQWKKVQVEAYGEDHVRAGDWTPERATEFALGEYDRLLTHGLATPGHTVRFLVDATTRARVGSVWWHVPAAAEPGKVRSLFIYWIGIDEPFRRRGYGRAALERLDREAEAAGVRFVDLHVFGDNAGAIRLYSSSGFESRGMRMRKTLGTGPPGRA
jgi:ribosomal protein S18 acetylase RimI-like enzyme